jgi:hypothetical protein
MRRVCCLLALACLAGCAGGGPVADPPPPVVSPTNFGVFAGVGPGVEAGLAEEAARQLWNVYPPPGNLLDFRQRVGGGDSFGPRLMNALLREGYFIHRWHDPAVRPQCGKKIPAERDGGGFRVVPVCYLVDDVQGMLRLTLYTAGGSWSRLFAAEGGRLKPLGAWTGEGGE